MTEYSVLDNLLYTITPEGDTELAFIDEFNPEVEVLWSLIPSPQRRWALIYRLENESHLTEKQASGILAHLVSRGLVSVGS